jgi:hypothetical protein
MMIMMFTEVIRKGKDIASLIFASKNMSAEEQRQKNRFYFELQMKQYRHFLVEKAIHTKCIPDVNNYSTQLFFQKFTSILESKGVSIATRTAERMNFVTRILTITHAIHVVFNIPTGKHYGKVFEPKLLPDITPHMWANWEILHFVCGLFEEQIINTSEMSVLKCMREIYDNNKTGKKFKETYTGRKNKNNVPGSHGNNQFRNMRDAFRNNMMFDSNSNDSSSANVSHLKHDINGSDRVQHSHNADNRTSDLSINDMITDGIDYNYVYVANSMKTLNENVYRLMEGSDVKPSPEQIDGILNDLKNRNIMIKDYIKKNVSDKEPVIDENSTESKHQGLSITQDGVYIHYSLLSACIEHNDAEKKNIIAQALKSMCYNETIDQKMIYGSTVDSYPELFKTIYAKKTDQKFIVKNIMGCGNSIKTLLHVGEDPVRYDQDNDSACFVLSKDFDTECIVQHLKKNRSEITEQNIREYHPMMITARENEWLLRKNGTNAGDIIQGQPIKINGTLNYPDDCIADYKSNEDNLKRISNDAESNPANITKYMSYNVKKTHAQSEVHKRFNIRDLFTYKIPNAPIPADALDRDSEQNDDTVVNVYSTRNTSPTIRSESVTDVRERQTSSESDEDTEDTFTVEQNSNTDRRVRHDRHDDNSNSSESNTIHTPASPIHPPETPEIESHWDTVLSNSNNATTASTVHVREIPVREEEEEEVNFDDLYEPVTGKRRKTSRDTTRAQAAFKRHRSKRNPSTSNNNDDMADTF